MATTTEQLVPDAPRWLFPLVVALHAAGLAALLAIGAPKVAPVVRALEIALLAEAATRQFQPEVHLRADRTTRYERLVEVMAHVHNAGIGMLGFVTLPSP